MRRHTLQLNLLLRNSNQQHAFEIEWIKIEMITTGSVNSQSLKLGINIEWWSKIAKYLVACIAKFFELG